RDQLRFRLGDLSGRLFILFCDGTCLPTLTRGAMASYFDTALFRMGVRGGLMSENPVLTVITPTLNYGHFLDACLASVALQSPEIPHEHLVLDGGSTDNTEEVVGMFPSAELVVLPGSSQSEALNEGFKRARGEVVCWLNADDILLQGAASAAMAALETAGDRAYVSSQYLAVDEDLGLLHRHHVPALSPWLYRNFAVYLPTSGAFMTRTIAEDGVVVDPDLKIVMDRDFQLQLYTRGYKFVHLAQYLSAFRFHGSNLSGVGKNHAGGVDPLAERRVAERNRISGQYGGVYLGQRRLMPPSRVLSRLAWLKFVVHLRLRRLKVRLDGKNAGVARELGDWVTTLQRRLDADEGATGRP
ncbi:MAG: glycosyltransferase, partial [Myxococcota bacterium]|nr:glycosyltransferase [Myxococcota bacterium]